MGRIALFSIHDVMPSTLEATETILGRLRDAGIAKVTLLVVPNTGWDDATIARLEHLGRNGSQLAGHGWEHRIAGIRNLRHWLHSVTISRDVAEHLALNRDDAVALMQRCYDWFVSKDLPAPSLYVPPAWAMGDPLRDDLDALPFRLFETLSGIYDAGSRRFTRTPMIGFEADTPFRAAVCRFWNRLNLAAGRGPVRFSIHPGDPDLLLRKDLEKLMHLDWEDRYYTELSRDARSAQAAKSANENS